MPHGPVPVLNSPFRYPGGKRWLLPRLRWWLLASHPSLLLEPFAGGAGASLAAVAEGLVPRARIVELDSDIASVWQCILGSDAGELAARVLAFEPDRSRVEAALEEESRGTVARAFRTLLRNRVAYRGVMTARAGLVRRGRDDGGFQSLWNRRTLAQRILTASLLRDRIDFLHGDGLQELERHLDVPAVAAFLDPPYTAQELGAGARFYRHHELDHERLFSLAAQMRGHPLLTYDENASVISLAAKAGLDAIP